MKKLTTLKTLLVGLCTMGAISAWADEVSLNPVGVLTWTNTPAITYDGSATSWAINQGGVSGGKIGKFAGPYAIVKFDASSTLANMTLLTATLDFDITAGTYNSSINISQMTDATFVPSTVTTETFDASATQFQAGDWSTKNATTHFSYDVKDRVGANNVIAFAIYTNTAREQTLKNVNLKLTYSSAPVAKYSYTLKAIKENGDEIKTLVSGEEFEGTSATAYFPYMFYEEGILYTTNQSSYSKTFDKDNTSATVVYSEASSDIIAYLEGESINAVSGENAAYSNGKAGYVAGGKSQTIATLEEGNYIATIYLVGNPNRSIVIRNAGISDNNSNTITSLPISKTSSAGIYTAEFELAEQTIISFSGYTTGEGKTNQSADIDYVFVKKTVPTTVKKEITAAGYATYCSLYPLDFSTVVGLTAYTATLSETEVNFTPVTGTIPAKTGVLLMGAEGEYQIPVAASSSNITSALIGVNKETVVEGAGIFVLMDGSEGVGFYKTTAESFTVGAHTAYIPASEENPSRSFIAIDEATAIKAIESKQQSSEIYNLAGQRVKSAQKGLYIIGGKKVVIK